jgi:hypothetical protein
MIDWREWPEKWEKLFVEYFRVKAGVSRESAEEYAKLMDVNEWNGEHPHSVVKEELSYL